MPIGPIFDAETGNQLGSVDGDKIVDLSGAQIGNLTAAGEIVLADGSSLGFLVHTQDPSRFTAAPANVRRV